MGPADPIAVGHGGALTLFAADLGALLDRLLVAGLHWPAGDQAAALERLVARAADLGLATPIRPILRLAAIVRLLRTTAEDAERAPALATAWAECQQLVAWLRLFRREVALLLVDARLARHDAPAPPTRPRLHAEVWIDGVEQTGEGLVWFGRDLDDDATVVLNDPSPQPPSTTTEPFISRLFQESIRLADAFGAIVVLEDHPVDDRGAVRLVGPSFGSRPTLRPVTAAFVPPPLPALDPDQGRPGMVAARLVWRGRPVWLDDGDAPIPLGESACLRLNGLKALTVAPEAAWRLAVLPRPEGGRVLHAEVDGRRMHPSFEPRLFRWSPSALGTAAQGACLATELAAARLGDPDALAVLHGRWPDDAALPEIAQLARLRVQTGAAALPADARDATLARARACLAANPPDDRGPWAALWLLHTHDALDRALLGQLFTRRYSVMSAHPPLHGICARTLALYVLGRDAAQAEAAEGMAPIDADAMDAQALDYLGAHIDTLRREIHRAPLPPIDALLALAEVSAIVGGEDLRGAWRALELPPMVLATCAARHLHRWVTEDGPSTRAADALQLIADAGLDAWFVRGPVDEGW